MYFRFIDQIESFSENGIRGLKHLNGKEPIFRDHFPTAPMLPAAMMVECASTLLRYWAWIQFGFDKTAIGTTFDRFRFHRSAYPGEVLSIEVIVSETMANVRGFVEDMPVFEGSISFRFFEFSRFYHLEEAQKELSHCQCKHHV